MNVELSGGSFNDHNLQAQPSGQLPAADDELNPIPNHTLEHGGSWGLLAIQIAICVVLAGYAILYMR